MIVFPRRLVSSVVMDAVDGVVRSVTGTASGATLPASGLLGAWYADQYQSSPRKAIPNSVSTQPLSKNLGPAPSRLFNNNSFWFKSNATVTDGVTESTVNLAAADAFVFASIPLLSQQYTMVVTARRAGAVNQSFRMSAISDGVDSGTFTATATDQRFSLTFTATAGDRSCAFVRTINAATSADLIIKEAVIYAGSADLGPEPTRGGHIYFGTGPGDTTVTAGTGYVDLGTNAGAFGILQFASAQSLSNYTVVAIGSKVDNTRTYSCILGQVVNQEEFSAMFDNQKTASAFFGGGGNQYSNISIVSADGYNPISVGYRFIGHRSTSAGAAAMFANKTKLLQKTGNTPTTPVSINQLLVGAFSSPSLTGGYRINSIAMWDRALSDDEMLQAYNALALRASASSITLATGSRYVVSLGDSLTADGTTPSYAHLFYPNASPRAYGAVYAQSGGTLTNLIANAATVDAVLPADRTGQTYILTVLIGTNDLTASSDVTGFLTDLAAFCDARRTAGWKVALGTLLPADRPNFNTRRNTANTTIRTWTGTHADVIIDFAANTTIGEDGDELNVTYYSDGVHPTLAGQTIMETIFRTAVNSL